MRPFCPGASYSPHSNSYSPIKTVSPAWTPASSSASVIGTPITEERGTPDGVGRYSVFERGSIYWTPQLGAHEVHGRIRDAWARSGWERGPLGYPTSDEYAEGDGRRSDFEHGFIHWSAATNTTTIGP